MKILALETSTDACSVAIRQSGRVVEHYQLAPMRHTELLLPMIEACLAEARCQVAQLDALAFGCGPGSFTGLRVAAAAIQALGFAWNCPVVPVSSLQTLAQSAYRQAGAASVLVALDARRQDVYWGTYQLGSNGLMTAVTPDGLYPVHNTPEVGAPTTWLGVGDAWTVYHAILPQRYQRQLQDVQSACKPHAQDVARLAGVQLEQGRMVTAAQALPVYLRDETLWQRA